LTGAFQFINRHVGVVIFCSVLSSLVLSVGSAPATAEVDSSDQQVRANSFCFSITSDQRYFTGPGYYDTLDYYRGVCEAVASTASCSFMMTPGDIDPPSNTQWTIETYIGVPPDYLWYPGVGNHEMETPEDMAWLRAYNPAGWGLPYIVNAGPAGCEETTYSFDYEDIHFVQLNVYYDGISDTGSDGDIVDTLYDWLAADLAATDKKRILVFGHEPAFPQPDQDSGRMRVLLSSLDKYPQNRDRFWELLRHYHVDAYVCGHSHNSSLVNINGVWQLDSGHAFGIYDLGSMSTYTMIYSGPDSIDYSVHRGSGYGGIYTLTASGMLDCAQCRTYVFQDDHYPDRFYQ